MAYKNKIIELSIIIFLLNAVMLIHSAEYNEKPIITSSYFENNAAYMSILNQAFASFSEERLLHVENPLRDVQNNALKTAQEYIFPNRDLLLKPRCNFLIYPAQEKGTLMFRFEESALQCILQKACRDINNYKYDITKLKNSLINYTSIQNLKYFLKYPGFPLELKPQILEEAQRVQKEDTILNTQLNLSFEGLDNIAKMKDLELTKVKSLFAASPYISKEQKEDDFALYDAIHYRDSAKLQYLQKYLEMGANPLSFLKEAVDWGIETPHPFYKTAVDYSFEHYPLYTAMHILRSTIKKGSTQKMEIALAIVKAHDMLQQAVENDPIIPREVVENENFLKLFLDYGAQFYNLPSIEEKYPNLTEKMVPFTHQAVKSCNIVSLLLLKKHGVDFSDPALIDVALQTKDFSCLSFVTAQQNKIPAFEVNVISGDG